MEGIEPPIIALRGAAFVSASSLKAGNASACLVCPGRSTPDCDVSALEAAHGGRCLLSSVGSSLDPLPGALMQLMVVQCVLMVLMHAEQMVRNDVRAIVRLLPGALLLLCILDTGMLRVLLGLCNLQVGTCPTAMFWLSSLVQSMSQTAQVAALTLLCNGACARARAHGGDCGRSRGDSGRACVAGLGLVRRSLYASQRRRIASRSMLFFLIYSGHYVLRDWFSCLLVRVCARVCARRGAHARSRSHA